MTEALTPHSETHEHDDDSFEYKILSNPYERMHYVHLTDELIAQMDGTVGGSPDFVVFLDKSARPVNWMVRELWDTLAAKQPDGTTPERPQSLFVNIDGRSKRDETPEGIANLRALFSVDDPAEGLEMMDAPTHLDDKKVLIVDEVAVSGDTLRRANHLISKAFPDADVTTHDWMNARPIRPDLPATNNPRWYERNSDRYRSVREHAAPGQEETLRASDPRVDRGWDWLAKFPEQQEEGTLQLMREIEQLAEDVRVGRLPYEPAYSREDDEERIREFSGMEPKDFYTFVRWMKQSYWPDYNVASTLTDETGPLSEENAREFARLEHVRRQQMLGHRGAKARFEFTPDPRTSEAVRYSEQLGFASQSLARQVKKAS